MKRLIVLLIAAAVSAASLSAGNSDFKTFMRRPVSGTHAVFFNSASGSILAYLENNSYLCAR